MPKRLGLREKPLVAGQRRTEVDSCPLVAPERPADGPLDPLSRSWRRSATASEQSWVSHTGQLPVVLEMIWPPPRAKPYNVRHDHLADLSTFQCDRRRRPTGWRTLKRLRSESTSASADRSMTRTPASATGAFSFIPMSPLSYSDNARDSWIVPPSIGTRPRGCGGEVDGPPPAPLSFRWLTGWPATRVHDIMLTVS